MHWELEIEIYDTPSDFDYADDFSLMDDAIASIEWTRPGHESSQFKDLNEGDRYSMSVFH